MTPEKIVDAIDNPVGKKIVVVIFDAFISNKLRYKDTLNAKPKNSDLKDGFIVHFLIKGSKDAIIINTRYFGIQLRIKDWGTFEKLDKYSENSF